MKYVQIVKIMENEMTLGRLMKYVSGSVHREHHNLRRHRAHLVGEAVLVDTIHVSRKCILPIGFPFSLGAF